MVRSFLLISLFLASAYSTVNGFKTVNGRIHITVGTTGMCPDTRNFIVDQLGPTYELYGDYLDIDFVPWGRTMKNPDGTLMCQFGPHNCWVDRLHRCVLNRLQGDTLTKLRYMTCEFTSLYPPTSPSFECVEAVGLNAEDMDFCVNNPQLDNLDQEAQTASEEPMAIIHFVPFILLNGEIDLGVQWEALRNLKNMVCQALLNDINTPIRSC